MLLSLAPALDQLPRQLTQDLRERCKVAEQGLHVSQQGSQHRRLSHALEQLWEAGRGGRAM